MKNLFEEIFQLIIAVWMFTIAVIIIFAPEYISVALGGLIQLVVKGPSRSPPYEFGIVCIFLIFLLPIWSKMIQSLRKQDQVRILT